jgi:starvation-inducible DNA-binding protein|tara:strand:- start:655 stop:1095 length:441 start_codon:yes stop_codon:yes gene_type:complete
MAINKAIAPHLETVLANSYVLYTKTQNFHWNVTGSSFHSLHKMFEEQYTDLATAIDEIAERIRTAGAKAPGCLAKYLAIADIKEGDENSTAKEMVQILAEDNMAMAEKLTDIMHKCNELGDEATSDLILKRIEKHEKNSWMLNSSL